MSTSLFYYFTPLDWKENVDSCFKCVHTVAKSTY